MSTFHKQTHFSANATDTFESLYVLCFEPMEPPGITWQELLPSLLVYREECLSFLLKWWRLSISSFIFALGVSGNILIIFTVMKKSSFNSPTNTFLASLASTDLLLIIICLPIKVSKIKSHFDFKVLDTLNWVRELFISHIFFFLLAILLYVC